MRTTVTIDDALIHELMLISEASSRSEAIRQAVESFLDKKRKERFKKLAGSGISDLDWLELEAEEIRRANRDE